MVYIQLNYSEVPVCMCLLILQQERGFVNAVGEARWYLGAFIDTYHYKIAATNGTDDRQATVTRTC
jgi:hypothetical protein